MKKFSSFANFVIESDLHLFLVIESKNRYPKHVSTTLKLVLLTYWFKYLLMFIWKFTDMLIKFVGYLFI